MAEYDVVIGLEVHAQVKTETKAWCGCKNSYGAPPNTNVCPVCMGMPGTLPVMNEKALELALRTALALNCEIQPVSAFARKNYFYPDLTKGYQITQWEQPVARGGYLDVELESGVKRVTLHRIQMEEDAGKNIHLEGTNVSLVDYNRCGAPLLEIISNPDISTVEEATEYLKTLRQLLMYLDVCDGNMEEGSFRCDVNVSLKPKGSDKLGVRSEMKNLNSFRFAQKALEFEIARHRQILEAGGTVRQETRQFDMTTGETKPMRGKEESHDYRYFPEPDLVTATASAELVSKIKAGMPELPKEKRARYESMGLSAYDAKVLTADKRLADFFEKAAAKCDAPKKICNYLTTELLGALNADGKDITQSPVSPDALAALVSMLEKETITSRQGKEIFEIMYKTSRSPEEIAADDRFKKADDSSVAAAVEQVISENPKEVEAYKAGKKQLIGFFVGQIMKKTKGGAKPDAAQKLLREKLGG